MATIYTDAQHGDDANDGLAWATAKQTLSAAVTAAGTDGIVYARGTFMAGCTLLDGQTLWGVGRCIVQALITMGARNTGTTSATVRAVTFTGSGTVRAWGDYGANTTITVYDCSFVECAIGLYAYGANENSGAAFIYAYGCRFIRCTKGLYVEDAGTKLIYARGYIYDSAFAQSVDGHIVVSANNAYAYAERCAFDAGSSYMVDAANDFDGKSNSYDFSAGTGKCRLGTTDYTTLADWRTATGGDANSLDQVPGWCDAAKDLLCPAPGGNLVNGPIPGIETIGYPYVASALSTNVNPTIWNACTLTNCELDASGNIVPSAGATEWTIETPWVDLGAKLRMRRIGPRITGEDITGGTGSYIWFDYDQFTGLGNSDSDLNCRLKVANTVGEQSSAAWTTLTYDEVWSTIRRARYWKLEITGRTDGD